MMLAASITYIGVRSTLFCVQIDNLWTALIVSSIKTAKPEDAQLLYPITSSIRGHQQK
jgi:hypothetical protein